VLSLIFVLFIKFLSNIIYLYLNTSYFVLIIEMKLCYIISTCDKYLDNRVKHQMDTMLKNMNKNDIYYLTSKPDIPNRRFGWNCMDDDKNITWKYIHFIYNMNIQDNYDWYIFFDDDTFVFENRLKNLLKEYNTDENYYIGNELDHVKNEFCSYMSGGAGYCISRALYKIIYNYVIEIGINNAFKHWCDDLCIGIWIDELKNKFNVNIVDNKLFSCGLHQMENELSDNITFHKVITEEQYDFYSLIANKETTSPIVPIVDKKLDTVFALVTDFKYFDKAKRTIIDLRSKGNWQKDIVLVTIDFDLNTNFKEFYNIIEIKFPLIDKTILLSKIGENGFTNNPDKRELNKLNQWEKLHVFDDYFLKWSRVVYLDAGLRVLDDVNNLLEVDYKNKIVAPRDGKIYENAEFIHQISFDNQELIKDFINEFGEEVLKSTFMLNCMWIYDTNLLNLCDKTQLIDAMNKYTFCKNNEMVIMNILFHFKYHLWERLPILSSNGKILFDWSELNNPGTTWKDYCFIKYPASLSFEDT